MVQLYRRKGGELLVNTETSGNQSGANLAALQGGGYVIVWTDSSALGADTSSSGIKAQRFDGDGNKVGGEFLVNTTVTGFQTAAFVTTFASGRFIVTWTDSSATGGDTSGSAVRAQMFEANGTPLGSEFLVNTATSGTQTAASVTELAGGGFVVSWSDSSGVGGDASGSGIKAQRFDAAGVKLGAEILVNTETSGSQNTPGIIALASGGFAVAWQGATSFNGVTVVGSVRVQLFDAAGAKVGTEQVASSSQEGNFSGPNIAALQSGFVVTWAQQDSIFFPGVPVTFNVQGQLFDASGAKLGAEFTVNTTTAGSQMAPDVDALPGGGFIVTWHSAGEGVTGFNVYGQIFDAAGARVGVEFIVSSATDGNQLTPKVDVLPSGDIVVTWSDNSGIGGDTSGTAVKMQVLTLSNDPPTDILLSNMAISETAREDVPLAVLKTVGALNSGYTYVILSDSSGGAFRIDGDKLVVDDNNLLDFETTTQVELLIRTTDDNGNSFEETIQLDIVNTPEAGYAAATGEFLVNTATQDNQSQPVITQLASGGFVVLWTEWVPFGSINTGKAQIYDAAGNPVGGELAIEGTSAAALPWGGFVVVGSAPDADLYGVVARIYDAAGVTDGSVIPVNSSTAGDQFFPSVASLPSGGFVVTWTDFAGGAFESDVRAQVFDASGGKLGAELVVPTVTAGRQEESEVAVLDSGGFVITWWDGTVQAQIFTASGARFGGPITVASDSSVEPHVTALATGGFVVTWARNISSGGFVGIDNLSAQIFDANGVRVGDVILISDDGPSQVRSVDVAALPWGGFVVAWADYDDASTNDAGIRAQAFDGSGAKVGEALFVNDVTVEDQIQPSIAVLASGDFVVGWTDQSGLGGDASGFGVKARLFTMEPEPTEGADILDGTEGDDVIHALGGDDLVNGLGGHDQLFGDGGDDQLYGNAGIDTLFGGAGNDRLEGGDNDDQLEGGAGDDLLYGGEADDVLIDESGNDQLYGENGSDSLSVTRRETEPASVVLIDGGADDDFVTFFGYRFADDVTVIGGGGNDRISVFRGETVTIDAGSGDDRVHLHFLGADYAITLGSGADFLILPQRFEPITRDGDIVVTDFETGEQGDRLELLPLLTSVLQGWSSDANPFASQHLRLVQDGADAVLQIDEDGTGGGAAFADLVRFQNRSVAAFTQHNLGGYPADGGPPTQTSFVGTEGDDLLWGSFGDDLIQGLGGADEIFGGAGDDRIEGGDASDRLDGQLGNDVLLGGAGDDELHDELGGNDELYGEAGADRLSVFRNEPSTVSNVLLDGGADNDALVISFHFGYTGTATLIGGAGNDDLYATGGRFVTIDGGTGDDYVEILFAEGPYTVTLGQGYDQLYVNAVLPSSPPDLSITVTDFAPGEIGPETDVLFLRDYLGTVFPDWDGITNLFETGHLQLMAAGADTLLRIDLDGYAGDEAAKDLVRFQNVVASTLTAHNLQGFVSGTFDLVGTPGADALVGSWGVNRLEGLGGDDLLDGRAGADRMIGGLGDDIYHVDHAADIAEELAGEGRDIAYATANYGLHAGTHVEVLSAASLGGTDPLQLSGNERDNEIYGNAGANVLRGGGGTDFLLGGFGDDTYYVTDGGEIIFEYADQGRDLIYTGLSHGLAAGSHVEILSAISVGGTDPLQLSGNELDQEIYGNAGANVLRGGGGVDLLLGGFGDDTYYVTDGREIIFEYGGEGRDTIYAGLSHGLAAGSHVEILSAISLSGTDPLQLSGNELDQEIYGNAGANVLRGGGGTDFLLGGFGDDTYYITSGGETIFEYAGEGRDIIYTSLSHGLAAGSHVEILSAISLSSTEAINLGGNELDNYIFGNAGQNILYGGGGLDNLIGGGGDDTYYILGGNEILSEEAGQGRDSAYTNVSYALAEGAEVEILSAASLGGTEALSLTGNSIANGIFGNAGANTIDGKGGGDYLAGGGGADSFAFTTTLGAGNVDTIADFLSGTDRIALDDAVFAGLGLGALDPGAFVVGSAAADADDRIVYDQATGALLFDADGSGLGAAVQFASVGPGTILAASDFTVI